MIRLDVVNVGVLPDSGNVVLIMRSSGLSRLLVMDIGPFEGRAIAMGAEGIKPPRPMTHDLLVESLLALGAKVSRVLIREFREQTFFATLTLDVAGGDAIDIDARPSDAVACAVRTGAPIFVSEAVLDEAGIEEQTEDEDDGMVPDDPDEEGPHLLH